MSGTPVEEVAAPVTATRRINWLVLAPLLIFLALAGLFLVRLFAGDPQKLPSAIIGKQVPDVTLPALDGLKDIPGFGAAALTRGQPTLVNVFASWCVPCHQEHPLLMEIARKGAIAIYGINYKDGTENARRFLGAKGNPYSAVGVDANGRAAIEWGVYGVPETFLVDGTGKILHKHVGPLTPDIADRIIAMARP